MAYVIMRLEHEFFRSTPWYVLHCPEIGKAFTDLRETVGRHGVLDRRSKALVALAAAAACRFEQGIEQYVHTAMDAGATREEITETLLLTSLTAAETQLERSGDAARAAMSTRGERQRMSPEAPARGRKENDDSR